MLLKKAHKKIFLLFELELLNLLQEGYLDSAPWSKLVAPVSFSSAHYT